MVTVKLEGMEQITAAIRKLGDDRDKRGEILKILRRQVKPAISAMRAEAPQANKTVKYHRDKSIEYAPGNLKRSIKSFTGKSKEAPTVYVGPQAKKAKGSGYYGWFVNWNKGGIVRGTNFLENTMRQTGQNVGKETTETVKKYIHKRAKQLGFD